MSPEPTGSRPLHKGDIPRGMFLLSLLACSPEPSSATPVAVLVEPAAGEAAVEIPANETAPAGSITGEPILPTTIVLGALSSNVVEGVLSAAGNELNACYTAELEKNPGLAGKVLVRFTIGKDGKVTAARTKSTSLWHPPTEDCLNTKLLGLQFPIPGEGGTALVTHPFVFPS